MENGLLYTFSTIAQALGGAFALLSAFVLYRFQSLDSTMWQDSDRLRGGLSGGQGDVFGYDTLRAQGKYAEVVREIDTVVTQHMDKDLFSLEETVFLFRLRESVLLHAGIAKAFKCAAWVTGAVMFGSVVVIPFAHIIYCWTILSWIALLVGVGGFTACLLMYWTVIKAALYER